MELNERVGVQIRTDAGGLGIDSLLGDLREWSLGPVEVPARFNNPEGPHGQVRLQVPDPDCERCSFCAAYVTGLDVEVLEAEGEGRPFPEVVSADFRRVYRLRLDVSDAVTYRGPADGRVACGSAVSVALDLTFVITADDVDVREDAMCRPGG